MNRDLRDDEGDERPDRIIIEKHQDGELQAVCVLLFDSNNQEHQVWFKGSTEEYELYEHKAPTRQILQADVDMYEDIREEAREFIDDRGYFVDEANQDV